MTQKIPKDPHFAIIITGQRYQSDDGYGGSGYEDYTEYNVYTSEEDWKHQIEYLSNSYNKKEFTAIRAIPATVTTTITVNVDKG